MKGKIKPIGLTKDGTWQFGLRKIFPYSQEFVWDFMFSKRGIRAWLGEIKEDLEIKKIHMTKAGVEVMIRVFVPYSHIRMTWKKKAWKNVSTLQIRVMGNANKATISFAHEKLLNERQRAEVKLYWNKKMADIEKALKLFQP